MIRYGIMSTSSISKRFVEAVSVVNNCEVAAIASRNYDKASEKAKEWGIQKAYGSYEELISDKNTDVIYVSMVNSDHYRWAKKALLAGKHVLCEKPFTLSEEESEELFKLAEQKKLFIMEAQKEVFLPVIGEVKKIISDGKIGEVTMADFSSSFDPGYNGWFYDKALGGGPLYGNAIYSIELMDYLFNSGIREITGSCTKGGHEVEEQFSVNWVLENGILVTNKTSIRCVLPHYGRIFGTKGYIDIPSYWKARKATVHYNDGTLEEISYPCDYELMYEIEHVNSCIESGMTVSPVMNKEITLRAIKAINEVKANFDR